MRYRWRLILPFLALALLVGLSAGCAGNAAETGGGNDAGKDEIPPAAHPVSEARVPAKAPPAEAGAAPKGAASRVAIDNFTYHPARLVVLAGTKVTWVNQDDVPHTVTSSAKPRAFQSGTLDTDDQFSHVFTKPGTYAYFCAVHPHMTAEVIVKAR